MRLTFLIVLGIAAASAAHAAQFETVSPNGRTAMALSANNAPTYSVRFGDHTILKESHLGLSLKGEPAWGSVRISTLSQRRVDNTWHPVWGKSSTIHNHFNETRYLIRETAAPRRSLALIVRAYNDGIAFRYVIPAHGTSRSFVLTHEDTTFNFGDDADVWAGETKSFHHAYEQEFPHAQLSELKAGAHVVLPLLAHTQGVYVAITEADLNDWAGMYLNPNGKGFGVDLSPRLDGEGLVRATLPHASPWRVIMLADRPGAFIESNIIENLNPPSRIKDTHWIKPGKSAWDRWWSADTLMDKETIERYIAFASEMGFPYQLIDWKWYGEENKPDSDIMRPVPELDLPAVLKFAKEHQVREWLWIHSGDITRFKNAGRLDAAFALYEKWGIAGVKIDFMDSNDQQMVNWYSEVLEVAARHHLMVDYHGAYVPTGLRVTWPNLLTREGVLGNEYYKFSTRSTPTHRLTIPFTRMIAGPMDYTPGGFLNRSPEEWKKTKPTEVMGSRAQELALFVVYYSPFTCLADDPEHYYNQPGLDFLRVVPTTWDETHVLEGTVGEDIVIARRKGRNWYVGGMTADHPLDYTLTFSFLGEGKYTAHIYADPTDSKANYEALSTSTQTVTKSTVLKLPMRVAGGFAIDLEPAK